MLTKIIAKRVEKPCLKSSIPIKPADMSVKGRYIGETKGEKIRLIQDVMFLTKQFRIPGIAIFWISEKLLTQ